MQGRPNGPTLGRAEGGPLVLSGRADIEIEWAGPGRVGKVGWAGPGRADLKLSGPGRAGPTSILNLPTSILNMFSMHKIAKKISRGRAGPG